MGKNSTQSKCPDCGFKCAICKKPDCDYDGDYVSVTECKRAARNDRRALWYRKTWMEIESAKDRHTQSKYVKKKDRVCNILTDVHTSA